jgi:hypothetical protein
MDDIINLRRARKARTRDEAAEQAAQNRVRHGRTKAERLQDAKQRALDTRKLDGARIEHKPQ